MPEKYNQFRAMLAITKASFRAILRSPSTVIFSIFFPLVFILVFGFIGTSGNTFYRVVVLNGSDTTNALYDSLKAMKVVKLQPQTDSAELESELIKGRITGLLNITKGDTTLG